MSDAALKDLNKDVVDATYISSSGGVAVDILQFLRSKTGKESLKKLLSDAELHKQAFKEKSKSVKDK